MYTKEMGVGYTHLERARRVVGYTNIGLPDEYGDQLGELSLHWACVRVARTRIEVEGMVSA